MNMNNKILTQIILQNVFGCMKYFINRKIDFLKLLTKLDLSVFMKLELKKQYVICKQKLKFD